MSIEILGDIQITEHSEKNARAGHFSLILYLYSLNINLQAFSSYEVSNYCNVKEVVLHCSKSKYIILPYIQMSSFPITSTHLRYNHAPMLSPCMHLRYHHAPTLPPCTYVTTMHLSYHHAPKLPPCTYVTTMHLSYHHAPTLPPCTYVTTMHLSYHYAPKLPL